MGTPPTNTRVSEPRGPTSWSSDASAASMAIWMVSSVHAMPGMASRTCAGVTTLTVATYAGTLDERLGTLRTMAELLDASGLATA